LSPIISTSSNGKRSRHFAICAAIAACPVPGSPLSPIAANLSELGLFGRRRSCADAGDDSVDSVVSRSATTDEQRIGFLRYVMITFRM
jgi:hypothetical protein